jgi:hypothetical protein
MFSVGARLDITGGQHIVVIDLFAIAVCCIDLTGIGPAAPDKSSI